MKHLFTTLAVALALAGSAFAETATIYGTLTLTPKGDGIDEPARQYYVVKTKYPVTVEMESYEQSREGDPAVIVQVVTSEIQIIALAGNPRAGETTEAYERRFDEVDRSLETLVGKKVRVEGETFAPENWNHRTAVLLTVDPDKGGSIREATAKLAPVGSNERGTAISTLVKLPPKQSDQLTNWAVNHASAQDADPVLSPDGKWIVFVRTLPNKTISTGANESAATELWQIGADGKNATILVRPKENDKMESVLAGFHNLQFSTDGRYVFFLSDAWATSKALHVVDTTNGKEHFVCPATDFEVVGSGEYRDFLLVGMHRYFIGAGSYDWFWLVRPDGKEIGPVGEDVENFKANYLKTKTASPAAPEGSNER
jgi:hypothetical protein